jgi:hypothetical protein
MKSSLVARKGAASFLETKALCKSQAEYMVLVLKTTGCSSSTQKSVVEGREEHRFFLRRTRGGGGLAYVLCV